MLTGPVTNIAEFVNAIAGLEKHLGQIRSWFRGHSCENWKLQPSIFRGEDKFNEASMYLYFMNKAKTRHVKCPGNNDLLSWLFLMQHYGMKTRLLDWTESSLVALYFAVSNSEFDSFDGAVWCINPIQINYFQFSKRQIFHPLNTEIANLVLNGFDHDDAQEDNRIAALITDQFDPRHLVQCAASTLHGTHHPIETLNNSSEFLSKIVIPKGKKEYFRRVLRQFGITQSTVFPDLSNLAAEITNTKFTF